MTESEKPQRSLIAFLRSHSAIELRILLGVFVLWHAFTLIFSNACDFLSDAKEGEYGIWEEIAPKTPKEEKRDPTRFERWVDFSEENLKKGDFLDRVYYRVRKAGDIWLRKTGQEQGWSLFAPSIATFSSFVAVEMRWDHDQLPRRTIPRRLVSLGSGHLLSLLANETALQKKKMRAPLLLLSYNEPENIHSYFRFKNYRVRRFESNFEMDLRVDQRVQQAERKGWLRWAEQMSGEKIIPRTIEKAHKAWGDTIYNKVWRERREMAAYMRWKVNCYLEENPGTPTPTQVRLVMRTYTINAPNGSKPFRWSWHPADMNVPVARWIPWRTNAPEPVQYFDPESGRFKDYPS